MLRIVLDTNILVSGLIAKGKPRTLWEEILEHNVQLVISDEILNEFIGVMKEERFRRWVSGEQTKRFTQSVKKLAEIIKIKSSFRVIKDDPDDNMVINTAYDGKVDYIVSGDSDLLSLKEFEGIKIVTTSEMLKILESKRNNLQ